MTEALKQARKAYDLDEVPVGAILVRNDRILARAHNLREKTNDPSSHAEIEAIRKASRKLSSWRLEGCELFVTLEPCMMCLAACQQARLKKITFGAWDKKGGALSLGFRFHEDPRTHHRFDVTFEECSEGSLLLSQFFREKRISKTR